MEKHTGRTRFAHKCAVCARKFVTLENMEAHMQQKHGFTVRDNNDGKGKNVSGRNLKRMVGDKKGWVGECGKEVRVQWECIVDGSF